MKNLNNNDFTIIIDYDKHSEKPSRVFESMSNIIKSFEQFDKDLVKHIDNKIETVLLLEDIEKGSLKTVLANIIKQIPDDSINDLDWKKAIGHYLLKAKYILLDNLEGKTLITDGGAIEDIEYEIIESAKEHKIDKLITYVPPSKKTIIQNIDSINKSLEPLSKSDKVFYQYKDKKASFNLSLKLDYENLEELITNETFESTSKMVLKVKKPDYLGDSKWSFRHGSKPLDAKINDTEWLFKFRNREIDVRPQDALVCDVKTIVKYDHDNNLIGTSFEINKIISVRSAGYEQEKLF